MLKQRSRAERNDPRQWSAKSGGPGGVGRPTVSDCMDGYTPSHGSVPRLKTTYRGSRRNDARVMRRATSRRAA
jgi:hypothetical protein